jgi:hypothetical protein
MIVSPLGWLFGAVDKAQLVPHKNIKINQIVGILSDLLLNKTCRSIDRSVCNLAAS